MMQRAAGLALQLFAAIVVITLLTAWSVLAPRFRLLGVRGLEGAAAIVFCPLFPTIVALFMRRSRSPPDRTQAFFAVVFFEACPHCRAAGIKLPSTGDWAPDVARQTRTTEGDILTLSDVRDFDYGPTPTSPRSGASAPMNARSW